MIDWPDVKARHPDQAAAMLERKRRDCIRCARAWLRCSTYSLRTRKAFARPFIAMATWCAREIAA